MKSVQDLRMSRYTASVWEDGVTVTYCGVGAHEELVGAGVITLLV
jgi:hypothetical protein